MLLTRRRWHDAYDLGVPIDREWSAVPIPAYLARACERLPDGTAIVFQNVEITWKELKEDVDRMADALFGLGVKRGDSVAIHLPNLPQTVISILAVLTIGARCVMTNPLYVERELEHQWRDARCKVAITADFLFESKIRHIRDQLPVKDYIIASIPEYLGFPLNVFAHFKLKRMDPPSVASVEPGPGIHFFRDFLKDADVERPTIPIDADDIAFIQYTGGTTGVSKGACLTHRTLSANIQQLLAWYPCLEPGKEVALSALPFFHVFGLVGTMLLPIASGATMVLIPNPRDTASLVRALTRHAITLLAAVPPLYAAICRHKGIAGTDLSSIKVCISGAAPMPQETIVEFEELTGCRVVEAFGMTELSLASHANPYLGKQKPGTIGVPLPGTDARIVLRVEADDSANDEEAPVGEVGELWIRGPQVMTGYWNRKDETRLVMEGAWLKTGDLATMDEEGYFRIVGRVKDMIKTSGYCVYPDEIDHVLMQHPDILECASIGVPDPVKGEIIKAFIVMKPGKTFDETALRAFCDERLSPYKVPRHYEELDALPRSGVLKILRRELRDREVGELSKTG